MLHGVRKQPNVVLLNPSKVVCCSYLQVLLFRKGHLCGWTLDQQDVVRQGWTPPTKSRRTNFSRASQWEHGKVMKNPYRTACSRFNDEFVVQGLWSWHKDDAKTAQLFNSQGSRVYQSIHSHPVPLFPPPGCGKRCDKPGPGKLPLLVEIVFGISS